ncbi:hypothetical protein [Marinicella rhabdoformis]|uniref:hypothetical protein n=1 Tax=Marinicella rhabdoformis TaxID=2580566 RepID=UPI0012AEDDB3|nr:hypothetical protein [Marinicella rhabdoformis]
MKKQLTITAFVFFSGIVVGETANDPSVERNLFAISQPVLTFQDEIELVNYIKSNKPSTFKYYDRLDQQAKKQVFKKHQEEQSKDITEIVLQIYRTHR